MFKKNITTNQLDIMLLFSIVIFIVFFKIVTGYKFKEEKYIDKIDTKDITIQENKEEIKLYSESDNIKFKKNDEEKEISYMRIVNYPHYKNNNKFRICFGSCNVNPKNRTIWQNISSYQPDLWIFLGDNYYNDIDIEKNKNFKKNEEVLINHFKVTNQMNYNPTFQKFLKEHQYLAIWDDHDYFKNNKDFNVNQELQILFRKSFLNFFKVPKNDVRHNRNGIYTYYDLVISDNNIIRFFLLDVRTTKSNLDILGKEQWNWLETNLKKSPACVNFLVSGTIFMADHNPKNSFESWEKTGWSFKKLEELLDIHKLKNVILISGDIHQGRTIVKNYLIEFTSSALTSNPSKNKISSHMGPPIEKNNFGFIDIDYTNINNLLFTGGLINLDNGTNSNLINFKAK